VGDNVEIRPIRKEEFLEALAVSQAAFGEEATQEDVDSWLPSFPFARSLAVFDTSRMVAISAVYSLELTVPGEKAVPMGGLTWIATLPSHRRQGLFRRLLAAHLADMTSRGELVSGLVASEGSIYGRFGYGTAADVLSFSVERAHSAFAPSASPAPGRFTMLGSDETATQLPAIYDSLRLRQVGTVGRPPELWQAHLSDPPHEREGGTRMFHLMHETPRGVPDGYVTYRVKEEWKGMTPRNVVQVVEVLAGDPQVYAALWRHVLDTDLCHAVRCGRGRVDEPLRWLLADPRRFLVDELADYLWLRLLDVPGALAARSYATAGRLVLEVSDPFPVPSVRRYLLTSSPAATECSPTSAEPELTLDVGTLGAAYLGGATFTTLAAARRVCELTPGAVARADSMFKTDTAPFSATEF
jgi:predicted acetyltransferase